MERHSTARAIAEARSGTRALLASGLSAQPATVNGMSLGDPLHQTAIRFGPDVANATTPEEAVCQMEPKPIRPSLLL